MTTTSECVEMYRLFTNSGLTPDEAAELVDGIARLSVTRTEGGAVAKTGRTTEGLDG